MDQILPNFASTEIKEEVRPTEKSLHALPRTVLRSNKYLLLDGEWNFALDKNDEGLIQGWHLHHKFIHKASWPGSVEEHLLKAHSREGASWHDKVVVWYERSFELHKTPTELSHLMYQLTFESD